MPKKKSKSKKKKKSSLSNFERKKLQIMIADRKNKIEWREVMCEVIKEDIQFYQEAYKFQKQDKENSIELLEKAINKQRVFSENIRAAIPEVEKQKMDTEKTRAQELANSLWQMSDEKTKNVEQLKTQQEKLTIIESYDVQKGKKQIAEIEQQLNFDDDAKRTKKIELKERQENALKTEMLHIFNEKAKAHQEKLSNELDRNIEQIAEETRWWKNSGDTLSSMKDSLEQSNAAIIADMKTQKKNLEQRKDSALQISTTVEEQERKIESIQKRYSKLKEEEEKEIELMSKQKWLVSKRESTKQDLETLKEELQSCQSFLKYNEYYIKDLEDQLSQTTELTERLQQVIEEAKTIITREVAYSLIKELDEEPKQENILIELESLFDKAAKFIIKTQH